jgi:hypothetical protein
MNYNLIFDCVKIGLTNTQNIYLTLIGTTLEYVCEVWDGSFEREISNLEMV